LFNAFRVRAVSGKVLIISKGTLGSGRGRNGQLKGKMSATRQEGDKISNQERAEERTQKRRQGLDSKTFAKKRIKIGADESNWSKGVKLATHGNAQRPRGKRATTDGEMAIYPKDTVGN